MKIAKLILGGILVSCPVVAITAVAIESFGRRQTLIVWCVEIAVVATIVIGVSFIFDALGVNH